MTPVVDLADQSAEAIRAAARATAERPPLSSVTGSSPESSNDEPPRRLVIVEARDIVERAIQWTWPGRLVRGALNLLEGPPEVGKTASVCDCLARFSAGADLPDGTPTTAQCITILGAEDGLEKTWRPRLRIAGADMGNVRFITGVLSAKCTTADRLVLPADLPMLHQEMTKRDLLYVDGSINDFARAGLRTGDDVAFRELLGGLHAIARQTNTTVWSSRHLKKGRGLDPMEAGSGTMGIMAKARSVFAVYRDPLDPERRLFCRIKCNLAAPVPTLAFRVQTEPGQPLQVIWLGEDPRSAADLLKQAAEVSKGGDSDPSPARRWLSAQLAGGAWHPVGVLQIKAITEPFSWEMVRKARAHLGIQVQGNAQRGYEWRDALAAHRARED